MPAVSFNQAMTTGHGKYKPTNINASQTKVFVGGIAVLIAGDLANYHGHNPVGQCIASQSKFFIGGIPVIMIGDSLTDDDHVAQGSPKFFIG